mmetsp:Transcript_7663/g.11517  ORF Transcript_7663/g.11517 Transcript_7663/m.11517 type:complete len:401 (-) Transcript_7663:118-1320(-)
MNVGILEQINDHVVALDIAGLKAMWSRYSSSDFPFTLGQQNMYSLAKAITGGSIEDYDSEVYVDLCQFCLSSFQSTTQNQNLANGNSEESAEILLREALFDFYVATGHFKEAANVLAELKLEGSSGQSFSDQTKADFYIKIAEAYLTDDEADAAEVYVGKASGLMISVTDITLQLRFCTVNARVLDANRKFLDAAMRYHELSQANQQNLDQDDLMELYARGVACAILGKAGPQRSRIISVLYGDKRFGALESDMNFSPHAHILKRIEKGQILDHRDMEAFEKTLSEHQKAMTGDGSNIYERAIVEHNLVAIGNVYENIRFEEVGLLLDITPKKAEQVSARMISEGRLLASIDQVEGLLVFDDETNEVYEWEKRVQNTFIQIAECSDLIKETYPQLFSEPK